MHDALAFSWFVTILLTVQPVSRRSALPPPGSSPRRWIIVVLGLGLLGAIGITGPADDARAREPLPQPAQSRYDVEVHLGLAYNAQAGASPRQQLDLFLPQMNGVSPPVLVFAPAGAWAAGDRRVYRPQARALAELGLGVA